MTGSVNCDIVSKRRGYFRGDKCITVYQKKAESILTLPFLLRYALCSVRCAFRTEQQQDNCHDLS